MKRSITNMKKVRDQAVLAAKRFAIYFQGVKWEWGHVGIPTEADILLCLLDRLDELIVDLEKSDDNETFVESGFSGGLKVIAARDDAEWPWDICFSFCDEQTIFPDDDETPAVTP